MILLRNELNKIGFGNCEIQLIREKFGIFVFRIIAGSESYVGKYFSDEQPHGRKEIRHYELLQSIGVPTLRMVAHTECLMLLEDIEASGRYRLGAEEDISNCATARLIAKWFRQLHERGRGAPKLDCLHNIEDALSMKKIRRAIQKSKDNPFWATLNNNLEGIKSTYARLCNTITYNDFWWDNMAVAIDGSSALMFDYNCLTRGYAYSDIRHILSVLSKEAGDAFLDAYGAYSEEEKAFEDLFFPLTGLLSPWAEKFEDMLHSGELIKRLNIFHSNTRSAPIPQASSCGGSCQPRAD